MKLPVLFMAACLLAGAQARSDAYRAYQSQESGVTVIHLSDAAHGIEVEIVPALGNRAIAMTVHGKNILYFPEGGIAEVQKHPDLNGIPFLAPWANRLDASSYWADGQEYLLNPNLHNYDIDGHSLPIHGLLHQSSVWEIADLGSDNNSARYTGRLAFWKYPELMAQWPFAQEYEMTYRLSGGTLEVRTTIRNLSQAAIPVAIGFHPYYRIPDKPRDEWTAHIPARQKIQTDDKLIPTGELTPANLPDPVPLRNRMLDTGFEDLVRDASGRAHFSIESGSEKIGIDFGPKYPVAILWEPPKRPFFCIEPMSGPTDVLNLAHEGKYSNLQSVPVGGSWTESFWITPSGL